jgi:triacylglycerol lipase
MGQIRLAMIAGLLATTGCGSSSTPESWQHSVKSSTLANTGVNGPDPDTRPEKLSGRHTQYPIILVHGFDDSGVVWESSHVHATLAADGHTIYVAQLSPLASVSRRAADLQPYVDQALNDQLKQGVTQPKVNLIAHSMGGLDSRELINVLGYGDRVASVTTISSPHRGSAIADFVLEVLPGWAEPALNALASAIAANISSADLAAGTDVNAMLISLSEANAGDFNRSHPDDPRIYYQSYAGVSSVFGIPDRADISACDGLLPNSPADAMDAQLVPAAVFVSHFADRGELIPNDGLVTVASAKWGTFRGCVPADHLKETGKVNPSAPDARTGFDHLRFYRNIAFDLTAAGF